LGAIGRKRTLQETIEKKINPEQNRGEVPGDPGEQGLVLSKEQKGSGSCKTSLAPG